MTPFQRCLSRWAAALLLALPALPAAAQTCTISWIVDADGAWSTASNWDLGRVPGPGDDVCIRRPAGNFTVTLSSGSFTVNSLHSEESFVLSGGLLNLAAASETESFTLTGGTLTGTGTLTVKGTQSWTGGVMSGGGSTEIAPGAELTISGGNNKFLSGGRKLINEGITIWTGGTLWFDNGSAIDNQALFDVRTESGFIYNGGTVASFLNFGTLRKSAGTGTLGFPGGVVLTNAGTVEVRTGVLNLAGSGSNTGRFEIAAGALLLFSNSFTLNTGSVLDGLSRLSNGTLTIAGEIDVESFELTAGNLTGSGIFAPAALTWTGGVMSGTGTTRIAPEAELTISGGNNKFLSGGRKLINEGTTTWTGGTLWFDNGSSIYNQALFDVQTEAGFIYNGGAVASFLNSGTLRKSTGTGTLGFPGGVVLTNAGTVEVRTGVLNLAGSGSNTGRFEIAAGALLLFSNSFTLNAGSVLDGLSRLSNGTLTIAGEIDVESFELTAGNLTGSGIFAPAALSWTGGVMSGTGTTRIGPGVSLAIGGGNNKFLSGGRKLINEGTTTWTGGTLWFDNGSAIDNRALFEVQTEAGFIYNGGTVASFLNSGTLRKSMGTGTLGFPGGVVLTNAGTVEVRTGVFNLSGSGSSTGRFDIASGALLLFSNSYTLNTGSILDGLSRLINGTLTIAGEIDVESFELTAGNLTGSGTFAPAALIWTGGAMSGAGTTRIGPKASLTIGSGNNKFLSSGRKLINEGTTTWTSGALWLDNGSSIDNRALFDVQTEAGFIYNGGSAASILNAGTLRKSTGTGTLGIPGGFVFTNSGMVEVRTGTLSVDGAFTNFSSATATLTGGTYVINGTFRFPNARIVTNAAAIVLDGPGARIVNQSSVDALAGLGTNTAQGSFTIRNGRGFASASPFVNAGRVEIGAGSTLTVPLYTQTGGSTRLDGGTLTTLVADSFNSENNGAGALNFNSFTQWNVTRGTVDLHGTNFFDVYPGNGLFVDLDGSTNSGGRLESKAVFQLVPGTYELSFKLGNHTVGGPTNTARVTLGSVYDETFTRTGTVPLETITRTITVTEPTSSRLVFDQSGGDNGGLIIDDVTLSAGMVDLQAGTLTGSGTIRGSYVQSAAGVLEIGIGGTDRFDRIDISDAASLAGTLKVRLLDGFRPLVGDTFQVLTFGSRAGQHTSFEGLNLGERQSLRATYGSQDLLLAGIMAGIRVDRPRLFSFEQGGSDELSISLAAQPSADVTISLSSGDETEGAVSPPSLTFTPADWNSPRTVTVTGVDDAIVDGNVEHALVIAPAVSNDPDYDGLDADDVPVTNRDDDTLDLQVDNLSVEPAAGLRSGSSLTVLWEVANLGNTASTTPFSDQVVVRNLTTRATLATIRIPVDETVPPDGSLSQQIDFTLPEGPNGAGQIEFEVTTDVDDQVFEIGPELSASFQAAVSTDYAEGNNSARTTVFSVLATPDLQVSNLRTEPTVGLQSGSSLLVRWEDDNTGVRVTTRPWSDQVIVRNLSTGETLIDASVPVEGPVEPGSSFSRQLAVTLPEGSRGAGTIRIEVRADITDQIFEIVETNNTAALDVESMLPPYADLAVSDVTAPALTIGDPASVTVSWTVTNRGTGPGTVETWRDEVIATGNGPDVVLARLDHTGPLAVGESYSRTETFSLPPAFEGRYRLLVRTDAAGAVSENGSEANNAAEADQPFDVVRRPYADLVVSAVNAPQAGSSGRTLGVSWTVTNRGIGVTDPNRWSDTVQLASDPAGQTIVASLGSFGHNGSLGVDGSYERSADVLLPQGVSGTFYVVVSTGGPFEFIYTGNNRAVSGPVAVTLSPSPDLVVRDIKAPVEAVSGSRIDLSWTVANRGTSLAEGSWTDAIVLRQVGGGNVISLGSFRSTAPLEPGRTYSRTEQLTLPIDTEGLYRAEVTTNADRSLYEHEATGNNSTADDATLRILLMPSPDLQVREVTAPAKVQAGGTAAVDFTIINQGNIAASRWSDRVLLSLDNKLGGDDLAVATLDNLSALDPGESYRSRTANFVVPGRFRGAAFFLVQTDSGGAVDEFRREDNNLFVLPVEVTPLPPADLVTGGVVAPSQVLAGTIIEVRYTVTNRGVGTTNASDWIDTVWLARDRKRPDPRKGDVLLGRFARAGALAVDESYDQTVTVTLPKGVNGELFITPLADAFDGVLEDTLSNNINPDDPNELDNNNYKARGITVLSEPPPDLVVTAVNPAPGGRGGEPFTVRWAVRNEGTNGTGEVAWLDRVYLSDFPALDAPGARRIPLGAVLRSGGLGAGQGYTAEQTFQLSPAAAGRFVIVETNVADNFQGALGAKEGPFTTNNTRSSATDVTTTASDLRVTSVITPPESFSGEKTTVQWTVENTGAPLWPGTRFWVDDVYVSPDATFLPGRATKLGRFAHAAADSYTQSQEVTLPKGIGGTFYIHVISDPEPRTSPGRDNDLSFYESSAYEGEGANEINLASASIPVTYREPDLRVTGLQLSETSPHAGETLRVTWTVGNVGNRNSREGSWVDRIYLSRDPSLDDGDTVIGQAGRDVILAAGESYTNALQVRIPDGIEGAFHVLAFTDSNFPEVADLPVGRVPEFQGEGNNITAVPLTVLQTLPPDLRVTSVSVPERVTSGQSFSLSYQVSNTGPGETAPTGFDQFGSPAYLWEDLYYLSRDASLDLQSDRFVGSERHSGRLASGKSYEATRTLRVPRDLQGAFYVFVVTDPLRPRSAVFEATNEGNNAASGAQPILIELPPPADLQVETVTSSASAQPGEKVQVQWTVANRGAFAAEGTWTDTVYLSMDAVFDSQDRVIGRAARLKTLLPGDRYTASLEAVLPSATPGSYRVLVRADVFNEVFEGSDEANNRTASADALTVSAPELRLGVPAGTSLSTGQERLYQLTVGANQTLVVTLTTPARNASNEVFLRFGEAPTGFEFDAMYQGALMADQTAVVPRTQAGTYFVLVRGQSEPDADTPVTLLADVLPFRIDDVIADQGGDARYVTATVTGAQFDPQALVKLVRPGFAEYEPVRYRVVDSTRIVALFDLRAAPRGLYDVKVINPDGRTAIVPYRYLVERALEPDVAVGLGGARVIAPGGAEIYGFSLKSLTNVDTPYVHFQYGLPELGTNPEVFGLKYVAFSTNLRGEPQVPNVPWADLDSAVNRDGEILATGYAFDLANRGSAGLSFTAHTYPGLNEIVDRELEPLKQALGRFYPGVSLEQGIEQLEQKFPGVKAVFDRAILPLDTKDPCLIAFRFHILASATPLTREEFITQQRGKAGRLREKILADPTASNALVLLAADAGSWEGLYLAALEQAGLLRPEDQAPEVRDNPVLISLMATLAAGIQAGPAGPEIRAESDLPRFFAQVRAWYGDDPTRTGQKLPPAPEAFDLGLSRRTRTEAFNVYVPFANKLGKCLLDDPGLVGVTPPDLARFFGTSGGLAQLATLTGPAAFGDRQLLPLGQPLPYAVQFENPPGAAAAVAEVRIVTQLDSDLDPRAFRLGDLRLGDLQVRVPAGMGAFQGDFDFRQRKGFLLRVSAGLDLQSNIATWLLQAIDPETGELVQDPARGLLPPNNAQGAGSGFVTWTILPKPGLATGTTVSAQARVLFNTLAPEDTLQIDQVIDGAAPTTTLTASVLEAGGADYQVDWIAQDNSSGVRHVTVYVSEDGGDFLIWRSRTTETTGVYQGRPGHTYQFLALATDNAGNREEPPFGLMAPEDGAPPNLGVLPTVSEATAPDFGPPPGLSGPSTNPLFVEARKGIPSARPATRPAELQKVLRPFTARAFATGIAQSHAGIGPMAIAVLPDRSVLASGGPGRNQLFLLPEQGGEVGKPFATLPYPVFDLALSDGKLWTATGGGPLLQLDPTTGAILGEFGERITQAVAVHPGNGKVYVSSGGGIEIFDPVQLTFRHFSDVRVGNLAFGPDGGLWAAVWPKRGDVVRFDPAASRPKPELKLRFAAPVDSLAFGAGSLESLLFVSDNRGNLTMVDLATLDTVAVATGGTRGDVVRTTPEGRVLISQSRQIDVLNPLLPPRVIATNPPPDAASALPLGTVSVTFDQDVPEAIYQLTGEASGPIEIQSIEYNPDARTAHLFFDALAADRYTLTVADPAYSGSFTAITDLSQFVSFDFSRARSLRSEATVSYDVKITNTGSNSLLLPVLLTLTPDQRFAGEPLGNQGKTPDGAWLIDLSGNLLRPGESTTGRTISVRNPAAERVAFDPSVSALTAPNAAPVFETQPVTQAAAGQIYTYSAQARDPDGGTTFSYLLYRAPSGMEVDANGTVTWSPSAASPGEAPVVLQVYDARGGHATQSFTVRVAGGNLAPVQADLPSEIEGKEGEPLEIDLSAIDPEGDQLIITADNLPPGAAIDQQVFRWTPGPQAAGTYPDVRFTIKDGVNEIRRSITLLIAPANQAPALLAPADRTVREGETLRLRLTASDPEDDPLTFSVGLLPGGAFLDPRTGQLEWTPAFFQHGVFEVPFSASDGELETTKTTTITVLDVNAAPVLAGLDRFEVRENQPITFRVLPFDPDNPAFVPQERREDGTLTDLQGTPPTVTTRASGLPTGASFDPETLVFTWTPGFADAGPHPVIFTATDDGNLSATATVNIEVLDANRPPVLADIANRSVERGAVLEVPVQATDADGDPLTFSAVGLPRFATFADRVFRFAPGAGDRGNYTITVRATDGALTAEKGFVLTVISLNEPPRLEPIGDKVAVLGEPLSFTITASDSDQEPLTFTADGLPPGATLTPGVVYGTAIFTWTPAAGAYSLSFRVSDAREEDRQTIRLVVRETNAAPTLDPVGPLSAAEGETLSVTLSASDPDGDSLLITASNLPPGAVLEQGTLRWTPNLFQAGSYPGIVITASDGHRSISRSVDIQVTNTNQAPVLQPLLPQSGREGAPLQLTLSASDPDGDVLTFEALSLPAGAQLDPRTGKLQWTPAFDQAGDYTVRFRASDANLVSEVETALRIANVNRPPTVQVSDRGAVAGLPLRFAVQASDPDAGTTLIYTASGLPEGAALDPRNGEVTWTPGPAQAGDYAVTFSVSDGEDAVRKSILLRATAAPEPPRVTIELTPSFPVVPGQTVSIRALASGVSEIAEVTAKLDGQNLSLTDGRALFVPPAPGRHLVEAEARDINGFVGRASAVLKIRDPQDVEAPVVSLDPTLRGTVADQDLDFWVLEISRPGSETPSEMARGDAPISGRLAVLGDLENGFHRFRLTAADRGGRVSRTETLIEVNAPVKPSQYQRSETDLSITLDGAKLDLVRSHDSLARDRSRSFSFGWRLASRDTDLQTSVPPNEPFRRGTRVYLTLPDGRRVGFTFAPERRELPGLIYYLPAWQSDSGIEYRLDSELTLLAAGGQRFYDLRAARPYHPASWTLTAPDGTVLQLDGDGKVTQELRPGGARLFQGSSGISTLGGETVRFTPEADDRIGAITAPDGTRVLYSYDAEGNLVSARNLATAQSRRFGVSDEIDHRLEIVTGEPGFALRYGPEPVTLPLAADLGSAHRFLAAPRVGNLSVGETDRFAFSLRSSEINSTASGQVYLGISVRATSFRPAVPVLPGLTPLLTRSGDNSAMALFSLRRDGLKLLEISAAEGSGDYTLELWIPGDINLDGKVDGRDSELLSQADTDRDGTVDAADLQLLGGNYGFAINLPPVAKDGQSLTHVDLPVTFDLAASDPEDDPVSFRISEAEHGTAAINPDGRTATFTPDPGYSGPATVRFQADDGYEISPLAMFSVNVSAAPLVRIDVKLRSALIAPGEIAKLTATGDFTDQKGVSLPASYLTLASTQPEVATLSADGRVRGIGAGSTVLLASRGDIQAATVLNVGDTGDPLLPLTFTGLQVYPASSALASPGGTRQFQVNLEGAAYYVGNRSLLTVGPGGLMTALSAGDTTVTIISRGQELIIPVRIEAPRSSPATLGPDGGVLRTANGSVLSVPPGALTENRTVRFEPLSDADLSAAVPQPFTYLSGFRLEAGEDALRQPLQLAVPVDAPAGSRVYFFRYGTTPDESGNPRPSLFQDDFGIVGPDGVARTASPPWPGILKSGEYVVAAADPSQVTELQIEISFARPVEESDLEALIVAAPTGAQPAPLTRRLSLEGPPTVIERIGTETNLGPIASGLALVRFPGTSFPPLVTLLVSYVVPRAVEIIEMIQIRPAGLPVITRFGVEIDPGAVTQLTATVVNDRPPITSARFAPRIDQATLTVPSEGQADPILTLVGDRFRMGIPLDDLIIRFEQDRGEILAGKEKENGSVSALIPNILDLPASTPGVEYSMRGDKKEQLRVPIPSGVTVGLSRISLIRKHEDKQAESNQVRLVQQRNYLFAALGFDQAAVVDAQETLPPSASNPLPEPNPDFNKLVARVPVGDPNAFNSPRAVAVTGDGTRAYVTLANNPGLAVIDALALQEVDDDRVVLPPGSRPFWVVVDDLNRLAYVSDEMGYPGGGRIYVVNIDPRSAKYHEMRTLDVAGANTEYGLRGMALSSDGRRLYVAIPGSKPVGIFGGIAGFNGQIAIFDTDPENRKREELDPKNSPKRFLTRIGLVETNIPGETHGIAATNNPLRMIFTNRLIDSQGVGLLEEDPTGPSWKIRSSIGLDLGLPNTSFEVNNARAVAVSPDLSYAFVTGFNRYIKDRPDHDPYVRPRRPAGGNVGILRDPFRLKPGLPGSGTLVAGTRPIPWSFPDNLVISPDGRTLWVGYYGTHAIFAFAVEEIKRTVEGKLIDPVTGNPVSLVDLQARPIDDWNGLIDLKADYRQDFDGVFKVPFDNPPGSNPRGPIASGGLPQGLAVQNNFLRLIAPIGSEPDRAPLFLWDFSGVEVSKVNLYVSVFPEGEGLLPGDRPFDVADVKLEGVKTDEEKLAILSLMGDFNPNRIVTKTWDSPETMYQLPLARALTAGQSYYWAVEAITPTGQRNIKLGQFHTNRVLPRNPNAFSSVTIITHGFDFPALIDFGVSDVLKNVGLDFSLPSFIKRPGEEQPVVAKFFELGAQIARAGSVGDLNDEKPDGGGLLRVYRREGGRWVNVDEAGLELNTSARPEQFLGRPLVLVNNWIQESFISESGFSEGAADAFFAALVQLDKDTGGAVFNSPIHLIGQSRGTIVTSELVQRLGTYERRIPDVHVTLLDPHDFKQDSLDIQAGTLLDYFGKAADYAAEAFVEVPVVAGAAKALGTFLAFARKTLELTGNDTLLYGDFHEPKIQIWDNVTFADSYFQTAPVLEGCALTGAGFSLTSCLTLTPGGRGIPDLVSTEQTVQPPFPMGGKPDIAGFMGTRQGQPGRASSRAGFTNDVDFGFTIPTISIGPITIPGDKIGLGLGRVHLRVFPWYAGTTDLSITKFPLSEDEGEFFREDLFRSKSDFRHERLFDSSFHSPKDVGRLPFSWYTPDHKEASNPVSGKPWTVGDPEAPWEGIGTGWFHSVLGGGQDLRPQQPAGTRIPVTFDNTKQGHGGDLPVPTVFNGNFDAGLRPFRGRFPFFFYEIPGWSYHNLPQGEKVKTFNFDSLHLVDRCEDEPESAPQCGRKPGKSGEEVKATNFAIRLGALPEKPQYALTVQVPDGNSNQIRRNDSEDKIKTIYQRLCDSTTPVDSFDEYPFSGPAIEGQTKLHTETAPCATTSVAVPNVRVDWEILGTGKSGSAILTLTDRDFALDMPGSVGVYTVKLTYTFDGAGPVSFQRKLFVTHKAPATIVPTDPKDPLGPPRRVWYERAVAWASGAPAQSEADLLKQLLSGMYAYGQTHWRYGLFGESYCSWESLVAPEPLACNYSDCNRFGSAFEYMAATLGIGGIAPSSFTEINGFLTREGLSSYPQFSGNAFPGQSATADRFFFPFHCLKAKGGTIYDATFGRTYTNRSEFISSVGVNQDPIGVCTSMNDGTVVAFDLFEGLPSPPGHLIFLKYRYFVPRREAPITGIEDRLVDENGDGRAEALAADVELDVMAAGKYRVVGRLRKNGLIDAVNVLQDVVAPGPRTVSLRFSGEKIFSSGQDGPYELDVTVIGPSSCTGATVLTQPYDREQFGGGGN